MREMGLMVLVVGVFIAGALLGQSFHPPCPELPPVNEKVEEVRQEQQAIRDANSDIFDISCPDDIDEDVLKAFGLISEGWESRISTKPSKEKD